MSTTIVIPMYSAALSENEHISLQQMKKVFKKQHFSIVCPREMNSSVDTLFSDVEYLVVNFPKKMFNNTRTYNRLLTSLEFYKNFTAYSHILICQLDVYVFSDSLSEWEQSPYDFIGAPTFEGHASCSTQFKSSLNGGVSLRNVGSMIKVLEQVPTQFNSIRSLYAMEKTWLLKCVRLFRDGLIYNYNTPKLHPIINEDLYWSYLVPREHPWFKIPTPQIAMTFSFDVHPRHLFTLNKEILPMAIHAWWRYDKEFVRELINNSQQKAL
ncbi:MAG: hypothetical protein ACI9FB_003816 [Candidatus Azotimanducaceae bacterium]|jgi:hypothetical protein